MRPFALVKLFFSVIRRWFKECVVQHRVATMLTWRVARVAEVFEFVMFCYLVRTLNSVMSANSCYQQLVILR